MNEVMVVNGFEILINASGKQNIKTPLNFPLSSLSIFLSVPYTENQGNEYQSTEKGRKGSNCFCNNFHEDRKEMKIPNTHW